MVFHRLPLFSLAPGCLPSTAPASSLGVSPNTKPSVSCWVGEELVGEGVCLPFPLISAICLVPAFWDTGASNSRTSLGFVAGAGKLLIGSSTAGSSWVSPLSSANASSHFAFPQNLTPLSPFLFIYFLKKFLYSFFSGSQEGGEINAYIHLPYLIDSHMELSYCAKTFSSPF